MNTWVFAVRLFGRYEVINILINKRTLYVRKTLSLLGSRVINDTVFEYFELVD